MKAKMGLPNDDDIDDIENNLSGPDAVLGLAAAFGAAGKKRNKPN